MEEREGGWVCQDSLPWPSTDEKAIKDARYDMHGAICDLASGKELKDAREREGEEEGRGCLIVEPGE